MYSIQEQEEHDYNMGRANEWQNAYALSSMERRLDDPRIAEELAKGKFVVVGMNEQYCPFTDACLPPWQSFISSHDTREEAEAQPEQHEDQGVLPTNPKWFAPLVTEPLDDLPF